MLSRKLSLILLSICVGGSAMADAVPSLPFLDRDGGRAYIISRDRLGSYIKAFNLQVYTGEDGRDHVRLNGWIPNECKDHIKVRLGNPDSDSVFEASSSSYPLYVEGVAITNAEGVTVTPDQCFNEHPATACVLSRNESERNCSQIQSLFDLSSIALNESGRIVYRAESTTINEQTGEPNEPVDSLLSNYTSQTEIAHEQEQEHLRETCRAAEEGDLSAISELRSMRGMAEIAERFENLAVEREFDNISGMDVTDLESANAKMQALYNFGREHREYRTRAAEKLMALGAYIKDELDIDAVTEDEERSRASSLNQSVNLAFRQIRSADKAYELAQRLGSRNARASRDRLALDELRLAIRYPDADGRNLRAAQRRVHGTLERAYNRAQREMNQGYRTRSNTQNFLEIQQLLANSNAAAAQSWQQRHQRGDYTTQNDNADGSPRPDHIHSASYYTGYVSPYQATYTPSYSAPYNPAYSGW